MPRSHSLLLQILLLLFTIQWGHSQSVTITDVITSSPTLAPSLANQIASPVVFPTTNTDTPSPAAIVDNNNAAATTQSQPSIATSNGVPTPVPTYASPTDDLFSAMIPTSLTAYGVLSISFPSSSAYNASQTDAVGSAVETFLSEFGNFSSVPVAVGVEYGDTFGVVSPQEGTTTIAATVSITVPWMEMNQISYMDEYALQVLISQIFDGHRDELDELLETTFGYGQDVEFSFVVILTPPTSMPTMSPTTAEAFNAYKSKLRRRSWGLVTLFWVIVLGCFSLENGLCACERFRKKKEEEYRGVELGSAGGFD